MNPSIDIEIRKEEEKDYLATEEMCLRAFWNLHGTGCNEHLLVRKLRKNEDYIPELSRIATIDGKVVATIMYSKAVIRDGEKEYPVITFGPLAVDPMYQNTGIGGKLLRYTIELAKEAGYPGILIFGEPKYYPKHGFVTADHFGFTDPDGKNYDAFMAFELQEGAFSNMKGKFFESEMFETLTMEEADEMAKEFQPILKGKFPCQWSYENANQEKDGYHVEPAEHYLKEFRSLFNEYIEELALYKPWFADKKDEWGNYLTPVHDEFFSAVEKKPFVIFDDDKAVGITVMSVPNAEELEDDCLSYIEEMYVEKASRGKGIATDIVKRYLRQQNGNVGFCVLKKNKKAVDIWEELMEKEGYKWKRFESDEDTWFYRVEIAVSE